MSKVKAKINNKQIYAVDLFCGIGGLTNGLEAAGINVLKGYDFEKSVQHAYEANNKSRFQLQDIRELDSQEIIDLFQKNNAQYTLVAGCAPCQPFSSHQKEKTTQAVKSHYKYPAFEHFIRIVDEVRPDFVTMENVRGITKDDNFTKFVEDLKTLEYVVDFKIVNIARYGAPQKRNRMLLVASRIGAIDLPTRTIDDKDFITVEQAIRHLPAIAAGQTDPNDPLHRAADLNNTNLQRIRHSIPGGTWKDWPKRLLPECYKRESGATFSSVYGRLSPDKPSSTLTTQFTRYGTGRYGHYEQDRALSLREGAIIQTFPDDYDFNVEVLGSTKVSMHIGNAVPPIAGLVIGQTFRKVVENE